MKKLLIFGLGYTANRLAARLAPLGWEIIGTGQSARPGVLALEDPALPAHIASASHILSSVPPDRNQGHDPVLAHYAAALARTPAWVGYLSSTGVYGDCQGAWVDESAPTGGGRRDARTAADAAWQALRPDVRIFRLPGIYGPGRSAISRVMAGERQRIDAPGHVFSRIHVDDIVQVLIAAMASPATGIFNVADGQPAAGAVVTGYACDLLGVARAPLTPLAEARLSPMARAFYSECRRVAARRLARDLNIRLLYPDYRAGLRACHAEETKK